jgi:hypothetical protein
MSLVSNISDLATSMATAVKGVKTLVNGNASDLSALTTTAKTNLVAAINEVDANVDALSGSAAGINDAATATTSTWSSSKTSSEISTASTADRARANHTGTQSADTVVDGTTNKAYTAAEKTKLAGIATGATANATDAQLRDRATHTGTQTAATISDFQATVDARISTVLDIAGAPTTLDTLNELAAALGDDPNYAATTTAALGNRVRVDAAQAFTGPQQAQGRSNIGAQAASEIGDTAANFVTTFEAGLV